MLPLRCRYFLMFLFFFFILALHLFLSGSSFTLMLRPFFVSSFTLRYMPVFLFLPLSWRYTVYFLLLPLPWHYIPFGFFLYPDAFLCAPSWTLTLIPFSISYAHVWFCISPFLGFFSHINDLRIKPDSAHHPSTIIFMTLVDYCSSFGLRATLVISVW